ncbi:MBL fold metallo-hydrolase [Streptomyces pathocidini]|uniref:MBL fold metallo-hydrolase n=1 Tax=Streptomyces pathocidini TaxID=1650571 RepID=UPI003400CCDB
MDRTWEEERAGNGSEEAAWRAAGWEPLAPGVARRRLPGWDATAGVIHGQAAVLVVDAGSSLREGAGLRTAAERVLGRRVTHLALTHPHFDHVLGAAAFTGARIYGAVRMDLMLGGERGRAALREDAVSHGVDRDAAEEAVGLLPRPGHLISGDLAVSLGSGREAVLANVGPAHSGHDLAVLVPGRAGAPNVVFCGDLVEESGEPQAGPDAVPGQWPAALDRVLDLGGEDALYVPGHGAVVGAAFVRAQRARLASRFGVS